MHAHTLVLAVFAAVAAAQSSSTLSTVVMPSANATAITVTSVVTAFTTVCAEPTSFEFNGVTYIVEEPTTLTITDCPCTITTTEACPSSMPMGTGGYTAPVAPTTAAAPPYVISGAEANRQSIFGLAVAVGVLGLAAW